MSASCFFDDLFGCDALRGGDAEEIEAWGVEGEVEEGVAGEGRGFGHRDRVGGAAAGAEGDREDPAGAVLQAIADGSDAAPARQMRQRARRREWYCGDVCGCFL